MKKTKVLPVYAKFPLTLWGHQIALKYVGKSAVMTPTGEATALAMMPEEIFELHRIIDENVEDLTDRQIKDCDIGLISGMRLQAPETKKIIKRFHHYGKKVIEGGPGVTSYPEDSIADYKICGEAEITLPAFLGDFLKGNPREIYTEEDVIKEGRCLVNLIANNKPYLTSTPIPRWDLLDLSKYHSPAIQFSRGCPHSCEFCDIKSLFGGIPRTKETPQMINELEALKKTGYRGSVMFVDDNILGHKKNLRELLQSLIPWQQKNNYPFSPYTEASIDLAWPENKDILENMVKAGFNHIFTGIETTDKEVLEKTKKKQNLKMPLTKAVRTIQDAGLEVTAGFIFGLDGEKPDIFEKMYNFIQETGIVIAMPGLLTPLKGTDLYKRLKKEGRLKEESTGLNTHKNSLEFIPELPEEFLINNYKKFMEKIINPKNYFKRCRTLRDNLGANSKIASRGFNGVLAFGKTIPRVLPKKGGYEYAKYLVDTLIKRPSYIPEAVTQAIKRVHFEAVNEHGFENNDE